MAEEQDLEARLMPLIREADRLKATRIVYQGRLVSMTKADALHVETLAGALLSAVDADEPTRSAWRERGAAFFRQRARDAARVRADGASGEPSA